MMIIEHQLEGSTTSSSKTTSADLPPLAEPSYFKLKANFEDDNTAAGGVVANLRSESRPGPCQTRPGSLANGAPHQALGRIAARLGWSKSATAAAAGQQRLGESEAELDHCRRRQ